MDAMRSEMLVCDPSSVHRMILKKLLHKLGFYAKESNCGAEIMDLLRDRQASRKFSAIMITTEISDPSCWDLVASIRRSAMPHLINIPVIAIIHVGMLSEEYERQNGQMPGGGFIGSLHNPLKFEDVRELFEAMGMKSINPLLQPTQRHSLELLDKQQRSDKKVCE